LTKALKFKHIIYFWGGILKMKATGMIRSLDQLGRIVIPIELRRVLDIEIGDGLEFYSDDDSIVLKKYEPACIFCDNARDIRQYKGKNICGECYDLLKEEL
jgi:transcriptional pleiotropic regulator of transition state genes